MHQRLEESQMLDQERRRLQDHNKKKEKVVMKLTSDLENEKKHAQELEQRVAESALNDHEFKRIQEDVKKKDEK